VLDLVKLVGRVVCDEKQVDLRWLNRCCVVRIADNYNTELKEDVRRHGVIALEWSAPLSQRVTNMAVSALLINLWKSSIFWRGVISVLVVLEVTGSSSGLDMMVVRGEERSLLG